MMNLLQAATAAVRPRGVLALVIGGLLAASTACTDDGPMGRDEDVASVQFSSQSETIELGSTSQLSFEIRDQDGNLVDPDDVTIDLSSSAETVATVSESGLVTPVGTGTAVITIEVGGVTDTITITVINEISSIAVALDETNLVSDETATLDLTVLDTAGDPVVDPVLTFTSSDETVATVDDEGVVTAIAAGSATITVEGGGESDSIVVTVFDAASGGVTVSGSSFSIPFGDLITINDLVVVRDAGGVVVPDPELVFESTDETVATVDATGLLSALATGTALITVTSPDGAGSATFRLFVLNAENLATIEIEPMTATVAIGATEDLAVTGEDVIGGPRGDVLAVFTSGDETIATVNPVTGVVTGVAAGMATITAMAGALTAEAVITVQ